MAKTSFFQGVNWGPVPTGTDPMRGSILRIRADMRSRLADRNHQRLGVVDLVKAVLRCV